jgi:hypothetical protein
VELAALETHTDPDGHLWQPAGVSTRFRFIDEGEPTTEEETPVIYALCPCGAVRRFEVPA